MRAEAFALLRGLIEGVVLMPEEGRLSIALPGELAAMLAFSRRGEPRGGSCGAPPSGARLSLVAGARNLLVPLFQSHDITAYLRR